MTGVQQFFGILFLSPLVWLAMSLLVANVVHRHHERYKNKKWSELSEEEKDDITKPSMVGAVVITIALWGLIILL